MRAMFFTIIGSLLMTLVGCDNVLPSGASSTITANGQPMGWIERSSNPNCTVEVTFDGPLTDYESGKRDMMSELVSRGVFISPPGDSLTLTFSSGGAIEPKWDENCGLFPAKTEVVEESGKTVARFTVDTSKPIGKREGNTLTANIDIFDLDGTATMIFVTPYKKKVGMIMLDLVAITAK